MFRRLNVWAKFWTIATSKNIMGINESSNNLYLWVVQNGFIYQRYFCPGKLNIVWHPRRLQNVSEGVMGPYLSRASKAVSASRKIFLLFMDGSWQEVTNSQVLFAHAPWESAARRQNSQRLLSPFCSLAENHLFSQIQLRSHGKISCFHQCCIFFISFHIFHSDL